MRTKKGRMRIKDRGRLRERRKRKSMGKKRR